MKIITILGARPQFIKAATVSRALAAAGIEEMIVHTGQHYDYGMSNVFFDEMEIPSVYKNLNVGSGNHGRQTGQMLATIEETLLETKPDTVIVHGDTNSTLAGALAAVKLGIRVAHNEAGLRSWNRTMPEEHNRILTDHCADLLFCPTQTAVENLLRENVHSGVHLVGDVMFDAFLYYSRKAETIDGQFKALGLNPGGYLLCTLHRPYNTDDPDVLKRILNTLGSFADLIILPLHPRTLGKLKEYGISVPGNVKVIDPVGYFDMLLLEKHARMILTDSGGVQKEAYFCHVPCVTLRPETEWIETVEHGWNRLVGSDPELLREAVSTRWWPESSPSLFGDGDASRKISEILLSMK